MSIHVIMIKNATQLTQIWAGKEFAIGEEYLVPTDGNRVKWTTNDTLLAAITSSHALVGNGSSYITDVSEAIDYLKGNGVDPVSITDERIEVRTTNCVKGRKLHSRYISFITADSGNFDNTGINNDDFGDVEYRMYKWVNGSRISTTVNSEAEETWIVYAPSYSYEISGGDIDVPAILPVDQTADLNLWELHVSANMSLDIATGGAVPRMDLIANPRMKFTLGRNIGVDSSNNPAELPYNDPALGYPYTGGIPLPTNEIALVIKHPAGKQGEFQFHLQLYK